MRREWGPAVHAALGRWGDWQIRYADATGFPSTSSLARIFHPREQGQPRHRILCPDMETAVLRTHRAWLALTSIYRDAIFCKYAAPPRADGTAWTDHELAALLGVSRETFRTRVKRARSSIAIMLSMNHRG